MGKYRTQWARLLGMLFLAPHSSRQQPAHLPSGFLWGVRLQPRRHLHPPPTAPAGRGQHMVAHPGNSPVAGTAPSCLPRPQWDGPSLHPGKALQQDPLCGDPRVCQLDDTGYKTPGRDCSFSQLDPNLC